MNKLKKLRRKVMRRGYRVAYGRTPPTLEDLERYLRAVGRSLSRYFARESAYRINAYRELGLPRDPRNPRALCADYVRHMLTLGPPLEELAIEVAICADRWSLTRYQRVRALLDGVKRALDGREGMR